nr:MAG TPA: hypothetical protein [Caudoviricetes sp.]
MVPRLRRIVVLAMSKSVKCLIFNVVCELPRC